MIGLVCLIPGTMGAQQAAGSEARKKPAPAQIFSGTITRLTETSLTVVRRVLGHDPVIREFARDGQTQVEGVLRNSARVTVQYRNGEEGALLAVHIIVR